MKCPDCGLLSSPEAIRCDCGYDLLHGISHKQPFSARLLRRVLHARPSAGSMRHAAYLVDTILAVAVVLGVFAFSGGTFGPLGLAVACGCGLYLWIVRVAPKLGVGWQVAKYVARADETVKARLASHLSKTSAR